MIGLLLGFINMLPELLQQMQGTVTTALWKTLHLAQLEMNLSKYTQSQHAQ